VLRGHLREDDATVLPAQGRISTPPNSYQKRRNARVPPPAFRLDHSEEHELRVEHAARMATVERICSPPFSMS
jgi:hypothetical protein